MSRAPSTEPGAGGRGGEPELGQALSELRREVHLGMYHELRRRTAEDPSPTEEELSLGAYVEALEPQAREAVREMRRKGYATRSSGFYGYDHAAQVVEGCFEVPQRVAERLGEVGCEVERRGTITSIRFYPRSADLRDMKEKWDLVAELLPAGSHPVQATRDFGSDAFRRLHREGRLKSGFVQLWLDDMGTYADSPIDAPGRGVPVSGGLGSRE